MKHLVPAPGFGVGWPDQFVISKTAKLLDWLAVDVCRMEAATRPLRNMPSAYDVKRAKEAAASYVSRSQPSVSNGKAEKLLNQCEPETWTDEDGCPLPSEVGKLLAIHIGSIPTPSNINVLIFNRMLLDDVMALQPRFYELEAACRELRTTKEWQPSIATVVAAIREQKDAWRKRCFALDFAEEAYADLVEAIAKAEQYLAAKAEREQQRQAAIEYRPAIPMEPVRVSRPSWAKD